MLSMLQLAPEWIQRVFGRYVSRSVHRIQRRELSLKWSCAAYSKSGSIELIVFQPQGASLLAYMPKTKGPFVLGPESGEYRWGANDDWP